ncbi:MAG: thiamine pyrophosphate-binding protein [Chloroflexi bacterium]|nr:thiamine pyrophosphate-binding protein [Chloroflexota bacterium]
MAFRTFTGNPSQVIVEQLVASGIKYLFYNTGSREARFFDALHGHPEIDGILGLHEGAVTAMAGGFAQVNSEPAVMSVHLGAGLAQSLGQMINVWAASLPVVTITFVGDTGSYADRITLDLGHNAGPTSIAAPFMKANWTVVDPGGLAMAVDRAIKVATTPPIGPVHIAVYDRNLGSEQITTRIIEGPPVRPRAGYPDDRDVEELARILHDAERPLIYVGDGVNKSGAEQQLAKIAEHFGANIASMWGDLRGVSVAHPLHCGYFRGPVMDLDPDHIVAVGVRHGGSGKPTDFDVFKNAKKVVAVGPDVEIFENIPGLDLAIMADEARTIERLAELVRSEYEPAKYDGRRNRAYENARRLREERRAALQPAAEIPGYVRPLALLDAVDAGLEKMGGGLITTEQFAMPLEDVNEKPDGGSNIYIRPAGGSEGYGMGAPLGAKLAAPDRPVVGIVGDGSVYYSDSAFWTAAHHEIPVLYVIPNNGAYGIVAGAFAGAGGVMKDTGEYAGVVLDGADIVQLAGAFGVEGRKITDESQIVAAVEESLDTVEREGRPLVLDVKLPLGIPAGGRAAKQFRVASDVSSDRGRVGRGR